MECSPVLCSPRWQMKGSSSVGRSTKGHNYWAILRSFRTPMSTGQRGHEYQIPVVANGAGRLVESGRMGPVAAPQLGQVGLSGLINSR